MNREDIIRMAREAGLILLLDEDCFQRMGVKNFERTKRVIERFFQAAYAAGAAAEREACSAVCYRHAAFVVDPIDKERIHQCAAAIRARGQA